MSYTTLSWLFVQQQRKAVEYAGMITDEDEDEMKTMCVLRNIHPNFKLSGRFVGRILAEDGIRLKLGAGHTAITLSRCPFGMAGSVG